ncbi:PQQ-dependent sugar dehydrogenase [Spirosoma sp. KUDC1026]|uniref:PQQ-dependent sugar dehydrogenase n=1 Tax=Spirosoma sp. KUDC1026 TaxID=2745947 RepID=UPI00159BE459|nr:PQQ-dependent sugar dehydrogenase [Spirosoma sp. KUDC1026]QKZ14034.1 PQQ-dependent sugar dehydrogenase [Spirosoma sp. KUDC1026]
MLNKAFLSLLISLVATSVVAWLIAEACSQDSETTSSGTIMATASVLPTNLASLKADEPAPMAIQVVNAYPKLSFDSPVDYTYANDGTNRVFVVEQAGQIKVFENNPAAASAATYLDIQNKVAYGGEMGLLGLAFHPKFNENGYFYVNYTKNNPRETIVSRFKASSPKATSVEPGSEVILFRFEQPYANHNGGKVLFGPDGYLYVSTGDGGSGGDPKNNAQNKSSWLGKILRVDVNSTEKGHYGIPADNPYKGNKDGYREEIYAYGLRNPWRISFDAKGQLWAGDVGQNEIEEVDIVEKGGNYGWRVKEGKADYKASDPKPDATLISPVWQYSHANGDISITGGYVYRGAQNGALKGKYIYADYASGRVWALTADGKKATNNQLLTERAGSISAFGEDQKHELYLCDLSGGKILRIAAK